MRKCVLRGIPDERPKEGPFSIAQPVVQFFRDISVLHLHVAKRVVLGVSMLLLLLFGLLRRLLLLLVGNVEFPPLPVSNSKADARKRR